MTRTCTVCTHKDVRAINRALIDRVAYRRIAARFSVSETAVRRHNAEHLPELLSKAYKAQEIAEANSLLDRLEGWAKRIEDAIEKVEDDYNYAEFWRGVSVLRGYLELIGEITKKLDCKPQVNVLIAPQVQQVILDALYPYPEARQAVADGLAALEDAS